MLKKILPHAIVVILFVAISALYFYPAFSGYTLKQNDISMFMGMSKEIVEFRKEFEQEPLWTNSMFGGMPAYQISVFYPAEALKFIDKLFTLFLPKPANYLFLYLFGFYFLMITLRAKPPLAAVAAIAFAFSTYFLIILEAGHNSKAHAIGYMAPVLAGIIMTYRGKLLLGSAITALFLALQIDANHVQITYYFGILVLILILARLVQSIRENRLPEFVKASSLLLAAAIVAVLCSADMLLNTYEYGKYTIRGKTDLTISPDGTGNESNTTKGLDRDYVTQWSYGKDETLTLLIPNAKGGASGLIGLENSNVKGVPRNVQQSIAQSNAYWGDQPFTSGPVYVGAVVVLLFLLGAFFVEGPLKVALLITAILTIALSWGKNMMGLTNFFLDYVPGYDKFRAVTILLAITEFVFPFLGFIFVTRLFSNPGIILENKKKFLAVSGSLSLILLVFSVFPDTFFSFLSSAEKDMLNSRMSGDGADQVLAYAEGLKAARSSLFQADAFRSLIFVMGAIASMWFFAKGKLKQTWFIAALAILVVVDLWPVNKRYLNNEKERGKYVSWEAKEENEVAFVATNADLEILANEMEQNPQVADAVRKAEEEIKMEARESKTKASKDEINDAKFAALRFNTNYRVLPLSGTFQDGRTAYFHKSIGGYHGAKLKRIQEVYDFHIGPEIQTLINALQNDPTPESVNTALRGNGVLNMLNTEYIIYNPQAPPLQNPFNLGSAWFVEEVQIVENADQEIQTLGTIDPAYEAVVDQRFSNQVQGFEFAEAPDAAIAVVEHLPNYIKYTYESPVPQLTIFSEVYYDAGWKAYLDGEEVPHFRANYLLRAMVIPEGEHIVEFKFEPETYAFASMISMVSEILLILAVIGVAVITWRRNENLLSEPQG
jgi:hypothetical protein